MTALERVLAALEAGGHDPRRNGSGWTARCPAHEDRKASLSIGQGRDGRALVKCHAGCDLDRILGPLGLTAADLFEEQRSDLLLETRYPIRDASGALVATHVRRDGPDGKRFHWERDGKPTLGGMRVASLPLYGSDLVAAMPMDGPVIVTEGEKACDAARSQGLQAVATVTGAASCPDRRVLEALAGRDVVLWPDADEPGRSHMMKVSAGLAGIARTLRVFVWTEGPEGGDAVDYFAEGGTAETLRADLAAVSAVESSRRGSGPQAGPGEAAPKFRLIRLSEVPPRVLKWLWKHYIPRRMVTLLAGDGARLKSTMTLDIAARVTRGLPMPDGSLGLEAPADVIVLSTEDDLASVIVPRLGLAGADLKRVSTFKLRTPEGDDRDPLIERQDLATLSEAIAATSAALVIFDPLAGFTDGKTTDLHRNDDTRRMMAALHRLAEETETSILGIHHFSRAVRVEASHRLTGSLALVNAARSVLVVGPDPGDESGNRLILALSDKANLAPRSTPSLAYGAEVPDGSEHPRIQWHGATTVTARDLAAAAAPAEARGALDEAQEFLRESLQDGPKRVSEIVKDARSAGISQRTLERAKEAIGLRARRVGGAAGAGWWVWETRGANPITDEGGGVSENPMEQRSLPNAATPTSSREGDPAGDSVGSEFDRLARFLEDTP